MVQVGTRPKLSIIIKLNINYKFAVYIESTVAHLGDQFILGPNAARVDKYRWFENLNKFLIILKKYNLKVIIAAHPKLIIERLEDFITKEKLYKIRPRN